MKEAHSGYHPLAKSCLGTANCKALGWHLRKCSVHLASPRLQPTGSGKRGEPCWGDRVCSAPVQPLTQGVVHLLVLGADAGLHPVQRRFKVPHVHRRRSGRRCLLARRRSATASRFRPQRLLLDISYYLLMRLLPGCSSDLLAG